MSVENFKDNLNNVVKQISLNELNWNSLEWKSLFTNINQVVLNDAFVIYIYIYFQKLVILLHVNVNL